MKNSEFEKYLREEADAFFMDPNPVVLDKVMDALHKKKKRRLIWFWLIFPVLGAGIFGLLYTLSGPKNSNAIVAELHTQLHPSVQNRTENNGTSSGLSSSTTNDQIAGINQIPETKPVVVNRTPGKHNKKQNQQTYTATDETVRNTQQTGDTEPSVTNNEQTAGTNSETVTGKTLPVETTIRPVERTVDVESSIAERIHISFDRPDMFSSLPVNAITHPVITPPKFYRWSVGLWFRGGATSSIYSSNDPSDTSSRDYTAYRDSNDQFHFNYAAGLSVRFSPLRWLAIETGIGYSTLTSRERVLDNSANALEDTFFPEFTNASFGDLLGLSSSGVYKYHQNEYGFLTIPLHIYYQNRWKWIGVEAGGGASFDIPVYTRSYELSDDISQMVLRKDVNESDMNPLGVSLDVKANVVFHAGRFSFYAGPMFRYQVNSLYKSSYLIRQQPWFIGGETGVRVNF